MVRPLKPMSATSLHRNYSPAPSSFATTWPPITIRLRLQLCAKLGAGSFICRHIRQTSILSKWHSQNSKHTCAELGQEHSTRCSTHLPKSAISSLLTNVGTSSARQDMDQVKSLMPRCDCPPLAQSPNRRHRVRPMVHDSARPTHRSLE